MPKHTWPLNDSRCNSSSTESGVLIAHYQATARLLLKEVRTINGGATRGLFWDGPRNFEPWSDDEDDTSAGSPLSKLPGGPWVPLFSPEDGIPSF
ncbi:hypothetical protein AVEN_223588-1 [Araneus ventricosus]|uniref:Uncharacterized protein n=1 Tax=Araneus ventricosus TaxID=182803 RepID=A0A4Y2HJH1_ARAVE|nr:hypothetical protein AVEN_223588-1 [Araneus ventricosus]